MTRPFVLLSTQRSGSTWVIDMLNSHPSIVTYGELLLEDGRGRPPFGAQDRMFLQSYGLAHNYLPGSQFGKGFLFQYLDNIFETRPGISATGFKLMYGQYGAFPHLQEYMLSNNIYIAHLIRRNYLDIILSKEVATNRNIYHVEVADATPIPAIKLNVSKLLDELDHHERTIQGARNKFCRMGLPYMEVFHEDLQSNQSAFDSILNFLKIEPGTSRLTSSLRKIITVGHSEVIENYEQVKEKLAGTRFSNLLK